MRLLLRLNLFYGTLALLIWGGYQLVPDLHRYLPLGVVDTLFNQDSDSDIGGIVIHASNVTDEVGGLVWLVMAIIGAVGLMVTTSDVGYICAIVHLSNLDNSLVCSTQYPFCFEGQDIGFALSARETQRCGIGYTMME